MLTRVEIVAKYAAGGALQRVSKYVDGGAGGYAVPALSPEEVAAAAAQSSADREQRRVARARSLGSEFDAAVEVEQQEAEQEAAGAGDAVVGAGAAVVQPDEAAVEAEAAPVAALAVVVAASAGGARAAKRRAEDELLVVFEQQQAAGVARGVFAAGVGVPLGTLDGMLARARKRRCGVEA